MANAIGVAGDVWKTAFKQAVFQHGGLMPIREISWLELE